MLFLFLALIILISNISLLFHILEIADDEHERW